MRPQPQQYLEHSRTRQPDNIRGRPNDENHPCRPCTASISTAIFPTPSGSTLPTQAICPTDPPLHSGGTSETTSATSTASPTPSVAPVADIQCDASLGVATFDALNAQLSLAAEGNGASSCNCCAGGTVPCEQLATNGTAAVDLCGGAKQQCAGCGDLSVALKDIVVDCSNNEEVRGQGVIPYLDVVTLQLSIDDTTWAYPA